MKKLVRFSAAIGGLARSPSRPDGPGPGAVLPPRRGQLLELLRRGEAHGRRAVRHRVDRVEGDLFVMQIDPIPLCFEPHEAEYKLLQEGDAIDI